MDRIVKKILSKNDLGLSGSHQAGILIPKSLVKQSFFPLLDEEKMNPNRMIIFFSGSKEYNLNYIHYNSRVFGAGTRNEYRLTRLHSFLRDNNCSVGDKLVFVFNAEKEQYSLAVEKQMPQAIHLKYTKDNPLVIHANWEF